MTFTKIIIAIDQREFSELILNQGLDLAKENKAEIMLFHSINSQGLEDMLLPLPSQGLYPEIAASIYDIKHTQMDKKVQDTITLLQNYCEVAKTRGINAKFDYKIGEAGPLVCQIAKDFSADLIVMGRRGRTGFTEAMLGSISNYVVHYAPCSVLVIQPLS